MTAGHTRSSRKHLYLEALAVADEELTVTMESFIVLFVLHYIEMPPNIRINFVVTGKELPSSMRVRNQELKYKIVPQSMFDESIASACDFPSLISEEDIIVAGLCGVCRNIVKFSDDKFVHLLGFKTSCLNAPSEASVWTKFCELDVVDCAKQVIEALTDEGNCDDEFTLPDELPRFEKHMAQPIRMHNIYKLARTLAKEKTSSANGTPTKTKSVHITSSVPINDLNLEHTYAEGQQLSIADVVIFPSLWLIWKLVAESAPEALENLLPLTHKWLTTIQSEENERFSKCLNDLEPNTSRKLWASPTTLLINEVKNCSLYKCDPKRYNASQRIFTKQHNVEQSLEKVNKLGLEISSHPSEEGALAGERLDWSELPFEALPEGGELPQRRLQRKKDQLESLAREVIRIARPGDRIVDFCSGTGHLGIILAYKLPQCTIYLLENKEESLIRARSRVQKLRLANVRFFQCNLDYFIGKFEIGASLHACGVATDIVLMHCLGRRARFVCCPCCYGGCHQMPHISYPRSERFRAANITNLDYMNIAHCADQAHDLDKSSNIEKSYQGQLCMDIVDTDRKLHAEECGYQVRLRRLHPEDCTPKNRLLVGTI